MFRRYVIRKSREWNIREDKMRGENSFDATQEQKDEQGGRRAACPLDGLLGCLEAS